MTYMSLFLFRQNLAIIELRRDYQRIVCALEAWCLFAYSSLGRATIAASSGLRSDLVHTDEEAIKEGGGLSGGGGGPTNLIFGKYSY